MLSAFFSHKERPLLRRLCEFALDMQSCVPHAHAVGPTRAALLVVILSLREKLCLQRRSTG